MRIEIFAASLRLAITGLRRDVPTSVVAVAILAMAIAAGAAMFALVSGVLLRPLPVRDQSRLIVSWKDLPSAAYSHHPFGDREIDAAARGSQLLESAAGVDANGAGREVLVDDGHATFVKTALVSGRFFEVLGAVPLLGRALEGTDDVDGAESVAVISRGFWQRRYGASPHVLGRHVEIARRPFVIVGVIADLDFPRGVELWRPTHTVTGPFAGPARREIDLVGRLKPGVSLEQARLELAAMTTELERSAPAGETRGLVPVVRSLEEVIVGDVQPAIVALAIAVGLVLLIAAANVANLILLRGEARRQELAVRAALGASSGRIAAHLITESAILTVAAGVCGVALAWWALGALVSALPDALPRRDAIALDGRVIAAVTAALGVVMAIAGLIPAALLARTDVAMALRSGGRGAVGTPVRRTRRLLVVVQTSLAVATVAGAGLLVRTLVHLQSIDTGYATERLTLVELSLPQDKYEPRPRREQFLTDAIATLEGVPGIDAVTPVNIAPFAEDAGWDVPRFRAEGQSVDRAATNPALNLESVFPGYFSTLQIPIVRGRPFAAADRAGMLPVAIVSDDVAAVIWPTESAIGKRLNIGGSDSTEEWLTIVGVAASTRYRSLGRPRPTIYLPAAQFLVTAELLVLRTSLPLGSIVASCRERVAALDAGVHVVQVTPFDRMLDRPLARPRFQASLSSGFALTAFLLAAVGLYAVIAASVRQRRREIALRVAIGATARDLRRMIVGEAIHLTGTGVLLGLLLALGATRWLGALLAGVAPLDPPTLAAAALLLMLAAVVAAIVPTRRAAGINPVELLRE